jgi:cellulose synthase/poly-beta-1,6-N-acetylglucosamine synthase-like glycosyltransferase
MMEVVFWLSVCGVLYPYAGYPLLLWVMARALRRRPARRAAELPAISLIIPAYNEQERIEAKVDNTASLRYPLNRLQVLFVSDGSTDRTVELIQRRATAAMTVVVLPTRGGKAAALNAALARATGEIVVFSDASIALENDALERIVQSFGDPDIGCVSGEDHIAGAGGEAWYGRYELLLRRLESAVHSIAGASGSFYAQRRALCRPFTEGMAPDFLSVLRTVEQGYRAVSDPSALGTMAAVKNPRHEFDRKVRTLIRGMTTLFAHGHLLNPRRFPLFSFVVFSHKLMRWLAPCFMLTALVSPLALLDSGRYQAAFGVQIAGYLLAWGAFAGVAGVHRLMLGRIALYLGTVNTAVLVAWARYLRGVRQELWTPSQR